MWFTADLHFYHENIITKGYRDFRDAIEMNNVLIKNINEVVTERDHLWILGDLTMKGPKYRYQIEQLIRRINGVKHLVLGNHDQFRAFTYVDMGFTTVHTAVQVEEFWLVHDPAIAGVLTDTKFLCGHVHSLFVRQGNALNVGVDVWDYRPVHIETVREFWREND